MKCLVSLYFLLTFFPRVVSVESSWRPGGTRQKCLHINLYYCNEHVGAGRVHISDISLNLKESHSAMTSMIMKDRQTSGRRVILFSSTCFINLQF